ncbi:hypothetical protein TNCV_2160281 [Trichonephila clavipes]|nr:hypothetical protein TNCV_2160281 [Trichonephila clavipes]
MGFERLNVYRFRYETDPIVIRTQTWIPKKCKTTRWLLATDLVILNHDQVLRTTPEQATFSPNYHSTPTGWPLEVHAEIVEVEIGGVSIYRLFENFAQLIRTVTCMVLKALLAPCHDEFRWPHSDYVRQVALETTTNERMFEL